MTMTEAEKCREKQNFILVPGLSEHIIYSFYVDQYLSIKIGFKTTVQTRRKKSWSKKKSKLQLKGKRWKKRSDFRKFTFLFIPSESTFQLNWS